MSWAASGAIVITGVLASHPLAGAQPPAPLLTVVLALGAVLSSIVHVRLSVRRMGEATNLNELVLVPMMVLLPPAAAVLTALASGLVAEGILTRGQWRKMTFNVGGQVAGIGLGSSLHTALAGPGFTPGFAHLAAGLAAAAVLVGMNTLAMNGVLATVSNRDRVTTLVEDGFPSMLVSAGAALVGLLVAVLVAVAPLALPLVAVLPLLDAERVRARTSGYRQLEAERDRFERTVDGSSDGVVLLDAAGRVQVWNPRMEVLAGIAREEALGVTLRQLGYAGLLRPDSDPALPGRVLLGHRVVEVRRSGPPARSTHEGLVLSVRDVSREAEIARIHDDLVARVSHELRTPVTTVAGFLETLEARRDDLPDGRRRELVVAAGRGAGRLGELTANLVALSRIEPRVDPVDAASIRPRIDPRDVIVAVAEDLGLGDDIAISADEDARVWMNEADLRLVLTNLLHNVRRYGAPPITVTTHTDGRTVHLSVTDQGAGVPEPFAGLLFQPFTQASQGLRRTASGMGLGLAVVQSLVVANEGQVAYEATPSGGARFTISLPAATPGATDQTPASSTPMSWAGSGRDSRSPWP